MDAVFVGGLSAGAVLSLRHAQRYPGRARGLALYSTTLRYDGWTIPKLSFLLPLILKTPYFGKRYRFEEAFPYGIMDDKLRGRILAQMQSGDAAAAGFTATPGASLKQLWGLVAAVKRDLPSIKTPTLIVHAGNDDIASARSNALYVRDHIGGPTGTGSCSTEATIWSPSIRSATWWATPRRVSPGICFPTRSANASPPWPASLSPPRRRPLRKRRERPWMT